ncbi:hypothetical protein [Bacillus sp. PS06]|uniref:hypothetical protein n=1 Tax=Bacillus sp. PS06 TaxID=2764176 RepID=UPI00177B2C3B|nr:hypothetical protein [Bacillus sp. PS06]MBD8071587.1 hypothetical protein [Bacillus sp. PS06]
MRVFWRFFLVGFIALMFDDFLKQAVGFNYNLFSSDLNLLLATLDIFIFIIIFMSLDYLLRKFIIK